MLPLESQDLKQMIFLVQLRFYLIINHLFFSQTFIMDALPVEILAQIFGFLSWYAELPALSLTIIIIVSPKFGSFLMIASSRDAVHVDPAAPAIILHRCDSLSSSSVNAIIDRERVSHVENGD